MVRSRRRGGTIYLTADVDIDVSEVLHELSDEDLLEEIKERKLEAKAKARVTAADPFELLDEVLESLQRGDSREALFLLERILHPKFASVEACEKQFAKVRTAVVSEPVESGK